MNTPMWTRQCFSRKSQAHIPSRQGQARPRCRPSLETLEDRFAPAILTVNSLADSFNGNTPTAQLTLPEAVALVNSGGKPEALGQSSMPAGWASQITGSFGNNDTIQFAPGLVTQNSGYGAGVINLRAASDYSAGPSALAIDPGIKLTITGPATGKGGITLESQNSFDPSLRLFLVASANGSAGSLTLENLTLTGGHAIGFDGGNAGGGAGGAAAGMGGAILVEPGASLTLVNSTLSGNTAQGGNGGSNASHDVGLGGGGGGMSSAGQSALYSFNGDSGGGPNGGGGLSAGHASTSPANAGGFGGGGAGASYNGSAYMGQNGGAGGFAGGGGGGSDGRINIGNGGVGGFGGGGGGGGFVHKSYYGNTFLGKGGIGGYGGGQGGNGSSAANNSGGGGGGAGMGGGIFNDGGTVTVIQSTFVGDNAVGGLGGNRAANGQGLGGAIFNDGGSVTVTNSTLSGNGADRGSDIFNYGVQQGASSVAPLMLLTNSILANSTTRTTDYDQSPGSVGTGSDNLIQGNDGFSAGGIVSNANPMLSPLGNHGGTTPTLMPQGSSPVINAGNNLTISVIAGAEGVSNSAATDQNGQPRLTGTNINIGSVQGHLVTSTPPGSPLPPPAVTAASLQFLDLPSKVFAGQGPGIVAVEILDESGQVDTSDNTDQVGLSASASTFQGQWLATAENGIAYFTNVILPDPGLCNLIARPGARDELFPPVGVPVTVVPNTPTITTTAPHPSASPPLASATPVTPPSASPPPAPLLNVPPFLAQLDQLFAGMETVNADGSVTVTDSLFGLPFLVSTFTSSGSLESVTYFGIDVTLLFELM